MAKLKFGPEGLMNETPMWATWVFRITALLTTAIAFVVAGDPGIPDMKKVRILLYVKAVDMVVLGLSKLFGVKQDEETKPEEPKP